MTSPTKERLAGSQISVRIAVIGWAIVIAVLAIGELAKCVGEMG